jgi:hypothetical protein
MSTMLTVCQLPQRRDGMALDPVMGRRWKNRHFTTARGSSLDRGADFHLSADKSFALWKPPSGP